jgi:hypothetical protein
MRAAFEALLDREPGARAAGRTEIVVRCATAMAGGEVGDASRATTQATREATIAARPAPTIVAVAVAVLALLAGAGWWLAHAGRPSAAPPVAAPPVAAPPVAAPSVAVVVAAPPTPAPPAPAPPTPAPAQPLTPRPTVKPAARHLGPPPPSSPRAADAPALLDVNATPWAHVRVDGVPRGETPLLGLSLPPGTHTLELSNEPLGAHRELTLTLRPGEHARRVEDLTR